MNLLSAETSPYLLQHAHNPVHWHAWNDAALALAREENKPILVSIGYSTCHWCHVMERESFEDPDVAGLMNAFFVCIKVDREERPDLDQIYMDACQIQNGSGGWPLNCFLLPDGRPFFTGTYWPPSPAFNRPAWSQVLQHIHQIWVEKRPLAEEQAARLLAAISNMGKTPMAPNDGFLLKNDEKSAVLGKIMFELSQNFDQIDGGFGGSPKFPSSMAIRWLMAFHFHTKNPEALGHAFFSLEKMVRGGIFDQLGGGFARYATDSAWLVPHFEKMLYDNALLLSALSDAYKISKKAIFLEATEMTCDWVFREMSHAEGGFFSAQDADSEGVEGKFFVWEKKEVEQLLGADAALFCAFFDVTDDGNWEETNILNRPHDFLDFCKKENLDPDSTKKRLDFAKKTLFDHRSKRIWPSLDDKILLGWNALMVSGLCHAFEAVGHEIYREKAGAALGFVFSKMKKGDGKGGFFHTWKDGRAHVDAFLEDYAYLIAALLDFFEINHEQRWLDEAANLTELVFAQFFDEKTGFFYFTGSSSADLIARRHDFSDNATPSGNAVMASNLQRLGLYFENKEWLAAAQKMLAAMLDRTQKFPQAYPEWARGLLFEIAGRQEIVVTGPAAVDKARQIGNYFVPGRLLVASETGTGALPLLEGRAVFGGETLIYICENNACRAPISEVDESTFNA